MTEKKTWEDIENEDRVSEFINSKEFKDGFQKLVEADTWDKGRPKIYAKDGWVVEHWKNGTINKIKKIERYNET